MKLAIVHDYLNKYGGAERVIETLHEIYPDALIYTSIYTPSTIPSSFGDMYIRTSFMQKLPMPEKYFRYYLLFYPKAMESLDLTGYDVIFSSSSTFVKGVRPRKRAIHICYCHTHTHFVWDYDNYVKKEGLNIIIKKILPLATIYLKK